MKSIMTVNEREALAGKKVLIIDKCKNCLNGCDYWIGQTADVLERQGDYENRDLLIRLSDGSERCHYTISSLQLIGENDYEIEE